MKRPDSQSKQKWIEIIDKGLLGVWNTRGVSYFLQVNILEIKQLL